MAMKEIKSSQNPLVKHLVRLRKERKYREECNTVLVEGKKLVGELLNERAAKSVLFTDPSLLPQGIMGDNCFLATQEVIKKISGSQTPEGIVAEIAKPSEGNFEKAAFLLALDGVSDPGNLGTLLRTALALGWDGAFILDNCCDPYNDKALRAAKGATFKLPLRQGNWELLDNIRENCRLEAFAADMGGQDAASVKLKHGVLLVLGSEGQGLSGETLKRCKTVSVPMPGGAESLNVSIAGGILMYLIKNQKPLS